MNFDDVKFDSQDEICKLIDKIKDPYLAGILISKQQVIEKELLKVDYKALVVNIGGIEYLVDSISRDWLGRFSYRLVMGSDYQMNYDPHFLNYKMVSKFKEFLPTNAHLFGVADDKNMIEVL